MNVDVFGEDWEGKYVYYYIGVNSGKPSGFITDRKLEVGSIIAMQVLPFGTAVFGIKGMRIEGGKTIVEFDRNPNVIRAMEERDPKVLGRYEYTKENLEEDMQGVDEIVEKKKLPNPLGREFLAKSIETLKSKGHSNERILDVYVNFCGHSKEGVNKIIEEIELDKRAKLPDDQFIEHNPETPSLEEVIEKFYKESLTLSEQLEE
jgi:hypothetical protein